MNKNCHDQIGQAHQDLVLSVRAAKLAKRVGAATVGDLALFTAAELLSTSCFGETSLREFTEKLAQRGLRLGMTPAEVRGRPEAQGRIVTESKNANEKAQDDGPCCGHCATAAAKLRERSGGRLTVARRQEIFQALVSLQDRREMTVPESVRHIALKYQIGVSRVWQIEEEGIEEQWPPLGETVPSSLS
jgi:hypothetical protein